MTATAGPFRSKGAADGFVPGPSGSLPDHVQCSTKAYVASRRTPSQSSTLGHYAHLLNQEPDHVPEGHSAPNRSLRLIMGVESLRCRTPHCADLAVAVDLYELNELAASLA